MPQFTHNDHYYMNMALDAARRVKGRTFPNPAVGAVIVKKEAVLGIGATRRCGGPHAERVALAKAGKSALGATMYVSLEPCCHVGRTPPCTDAIIASGISKVVVALKDPNPLVAGKGVAALRRQGITVVIGCMRKEAARLNEDFIFSVTASRSYITLKLALTLDGYIADSAGRSKWITSTAQRREVHELRRRHAAVAVGSGTLIADDPQLDVRFGRKASPSRVIFSSKKSIPESSWFFSNAHRARSIVVVRGTSKRKIVTDTLHDIEYWYTGERDLQVSMAVFCEMAFRADIPSVFVEGGAHIARVFLEAGLVNRLYLFYGNRILGGGKGGVRFSMPLSMERGITLSGMETHIYKDGMCVTGHPCRMKP